MSDWEEDKKRADWTLEKARKVSLIHFGIEMMAVDMDADIRRGRDLQTTGADIGLGCRAYDLERWGPRILKNATFRYSRPQRRGYRVAENGARGLQRIVLLLGLALAEEVPAMGSDRVDEGAALACRERGRSGDG